MALLRVVLLAVILLAVLDPVSAVPDCTQLPVWVANAQCKEYADYGAADVAVDRLRLKEFQAEDLDIFRSVLANVSNKYYPSITIQPENIAIVELFEDREGVLMLSFLVMNPSNSQAFPILFRTTELTLMIELNLKYINTALPYDIDPQPVEDTYPLFFPIWAIVIIVYFLLVVVGYLIVLATRNWNDSERKGSIDIDVESTDGGGAVLVNKSYTSYDQNDYAAVTHRKRTGTDTSQNNNITEVDHRQQETKDESIRTVSMQVRASDIDDKTAAATIEKEPEPAPSGGGSQRSDSVSGDGGEVNEAFDDGARTTSF